MKLREIIIALLLVASITSSVAILFEEGKHPWLMAISYATLGIFGLLDSGKTITRSYAYLLLLFSIVFFLSSIVR